MATKKRGKNSRERYLLRLKVVRPERKTHDPYFRLRYFARVSGGTLQELLQRYGLR